jgi:hypothetical protein
MSSALCFSFEARPATWSMMVCPHLGQGRERVTAVTWISTGVSQWGQVTWAADIRQGGTNT